MRWIVAVAFVLVVMAATALALAEYAAEDRGVMDPT